MPILKKMVSKKYELFFVKFYIWNKLWLYNHFMHFLEFFSFRFENLLSRSPLSLADGSGNLIVFEFFWYRFLIKITSIQAWVSH